MTEISNIGNVSGVGSVTGTGAAIQVNLGFTPSVVQVINTTHEVVLWYDSAMPSGYGYKSIGTGAGTIGNTTATNATSAVTGTGTFLGTASTSGEVTAFSGTGQSSSGQVITTTDNQTMTLDQCAGMWFISATHGPYYIVSNTAVTGAPAVLTVIGDAPTTDAGAYIIAKSPTPVGSVTALSGTAAAQDQSAHTHSFTGSGSDSAYITTGGITLNANGFTIGTDADLNQNGDNLLIVAWRK